MQCTKISPKFEFGGHSPPVVHLQKCGVGLQRWENQHRLSSFVLHLTPRRDTQLFHQSRLHVKLQNDIYVQGTGKQTEWELEWIEQWSEPNRKSSSMAEWFPVSHHRSDEMTLTSSTSSHWRTCRTTYIQHHHTSTRSRPASKTPNKYASYVDWRISPHVDHHHSCLLYTSTSPRD